LDGFPFSGRALRSILCHHFQATIIPVPCNIYFGFFLQKFIGKLNFLLLFSSFRSFFASFVHIPDKDVLYPGVPGLSPVRARPWRANKKTAGKHPVSRLPVRYRFFGMCAIVYCP
jgi:hypothetical protein